MKRIWTYFFITAGGLLAAAPSYAGQADGAAMPMPAKPAGAQADAVGGATASMGKATASSETAIPSSGGDIKRGDIILFPVDTAIYKAPDPVMNMNLKTYCAAAGSPFTVDDIDPEVMGNANLHVHFEKELFASTNFQCKTSAFKDVPPVELQQSYVVNSSDLPSSGPQKFGLAWGGLVIPYKYEFKDGSFSGTPSTVAFVGFQGAVAETTITFALVAGGGSSGSAQTTGGNKALWTFGGGLIFTFAKVFRQA